jgi:hypothetical protein
MVCSYDVSERCMRDDWYRKIGGIWALVEKAASRPIINEASIIK